MKVVHCKKEKYDVYIGRPSKWGNPFTHKAGTKAEFILPTREEAIAAYREWITKGDGKHLLNDLHELQGKTLGCWCKPQSCHGDVLLDLLNNQQGDAVSDTTEADSSNEAYLINKSIERLKRLPESRLVNTVIEDLSTFLSGGNKKIPSIDWEGLENSAQLAKVRIKNLFNDGNDSDRIDFAFDQLFEKLQDYIK